MSAKLLLLGFLVRGFPTLLLSLFGAEGGWWFFVFTVFENRHICGSVFY